MAHDPVVAALWERFSANARRHLEVLDAWHEGRAEHADALAVAHKLAGSLGTYGRPDGSRAASEIEESLEACLAGGRPDPRGEPATSERLDRLRSALD